ncbi:MAG: efflux RND transporter periplasmic adaptor subunit [Gemmatimonadales bacterium]
MRFSTRMLVLAGLGLGLAACSRKAVAPAASDTATWVGRENIAVAETRELSVGPAISGSLEAERQAMVRAELGSTVIEIDAEPGQTVARGAVLGRLDDTAIRDGFTSSQAMVRSAELSAQIATREVQRAKTLADAGAVATRDVESAQLSASSAEAQLASARAAAATAEKQLGRTIIRAPFSGVVSERPVSLGDVVQSGSAMFTIVDPASLKFEGQVPAEGLEGIKVGTPVSLVIAGMGAAPVIGRVSRINPSVDPATRQARLTVAVPNVGGRLVSGLFADGRVATTIRQGVVVPSGAVDRRGIRPVVMRVKQGKVDRVEVELGLIDAALEQIEVTSGITPGDTLLLGGARGLAPGVVVRVGSPAEINSRTSGE